jgi:hypothetical protein
VIESAAPRSLFLSREFHGAQGLAVTDEMAVACGAGLPADLNGYQAYDGLPASWSTLMRPAREVMDEDVVHQYDRCSPAKRRRRPRDAGWADVPTAARPLARL